MIPLLLLHGALGSSTQLDPLKRILVEEGFDVYSLNFSGHSGEPFSSNFGIETFTENILTFLNSKNLHTVNIFGYSMGGYVALWFAHLCPDRVGGIITLGTKFDWTPESALKEVKKLNADKIIEKVPAFARILQTRHAPNDWKELLEKTATMMLRLGDQPLLDESVVRKIHHHTFILLGDLDDMADRKYSEEVSRMLVNGKFIELLATPHPIEKVDLQLLRKVSREFYP